MRSLRIAGEERILDLVKKSLKIKKALTYEIDTCSFQLDGDQPNEGDEVIIEDGERLFAGVIVKVQLDKTYPQNLTRANTWSVDCDDYTALLDRHLVVETYENMSASDIFLDIVAKYCPDFTTTGVQSGAPVVEYIPFDYIHPSECFKQLCDYVGWHWQPAYYKDLQFFSAEALASPAPLELVPGGPFRFGKHSIDTQGLRNRVYVRGGTMLSDPQTIEWKADGVARTWVLPWKPHEITYNGELGKIGVGEVAKSIGIENVHEEADYDFLLNFQEKYIRCSSGTTTPAAGTTMSLTARQDIDVITMVEDLESQAAIAAVQGGDGVYEHVITDDSLTTIEAAEAAGQADLREHANPRVSGSFETEIPGWQPGQLVNINLPDRGVDGTFLVQNVGIQPIAAEWIYTVQYGGRLLRIADFLKALVSAQQKKKLNDTSILHKFTYGQEKVEVSDQLTITPKEPPWVVEQGYEQRYDLVMPGNATFTRASTAYKEDGTVVAVGEPRYENEEMLVEGTTNELTYNQALLKADWFEYGQSSYVDWIFDEINGGVIATVNTDITTEAYIEIQWPTNYFNDQDLTFSIDAEVLSDSIPSSVVGVYIYTCDETGYHYTRTFISETERYSVTRHVPTTPVNTTRTRITFKDGSTAGLSIKFTFAQVEQKDHATDFVIGTREYAYKKAIMVEEGTTNLVPLANQKFEGWTGYAGSVVTITQNVSVAEWNTSEATRMQTSGGSNTTKYYKSFVVPSVDGQSYAIQVKLRNIGATIIQVGCNLGPTQQVAPGETANINLVGTGDGSHYCQIQFQTLNISDNLDFIVFRPQIEAKAYCTSFTDGTRQPEVLTTTINDKVDLTDKWTISCKAKPNAVKMTENTKRAILWEIGEYYGANKCSITIRKESSGPKKLQLCVYDNLLQKTAVSISFTDADLAEDILFFVRYDGLNAYVSSYGIDSGFQTITDYNLIFKYPFADKLRIGSYAWTNGEWNEKISEVRVDNVCLTDEQIAADIQAGTLQQLPTTTALFTFEDTLTGDNQALSPVITAIGSKARIQDPESTAWPGLQIASRPEGGEWGEFTDVDPSRANEVDYPGEFIVKADRDCEALVKNWKKPFDETDAVCGFVECAGT